MFETLKFLRNRCLIFSSFLFLIFVIYSCTPTNPDNNKDSKWNVLGTEGFSSVVSANTDIAGLVFDNTGIPYVAYMETLNNDKNKAIVMKYNGSSWENVGEAASFSDTKTATDISLAINNSGTPYIAYRDMRAKGDGDSAKATVMKYSGSSWEVVGTPTFTTEAAHSISLAIDDKGTPYIAYLGGNPTPPERGGTIKVMKYESTTWEVVGNAGFSTEQAMSTSLAFYNNVPYVGYEERPNYSTTKLTVMKYSK